MFCPSCSGLAFPRKGVAGNVYTRVYARKKDKAVFENERIKHDKSMPKEEDSDEAHIRWAEQEPREFEKYLMGSDSEINNEDYIMCQNGRCGFHGPADDVDKNLLNARSNTAAKGRKYEVVKDSDKMQGVLTKDSYMCPKCDKMEVFAYLEQTRSSDEPETRMLTCKNCDHGWREY
jgi:DNA-directed RNA polymerase subunit M